MAIGVILCPQELRIRGIVSLKKEAMYYKSENIGGDEQNCPAQNEGFMCPPGSYCCASNKMTMRSSAYGK